MKSWFGQQLELFPTSPSRETNSPRATEPALRHNTDTQKDDRDQPTITQPPVYNAELYRRADLDTDEGFA